MRYIAINGPATVDELHDAVDGWSEDYFRKKIIDFSESSKVLKSKKVEEELILYIYNYEQECETPVAPDNTADDLDTPSNQDVGRMIKIAEGNPPGEVYDSDLPTTENDPVLQKALRVAVKDTPPGETPPEQSVHETGEVDVITTTEIDGSVTTPFRLPVYGQDTQVYPLTLRIYLPLIIVFTQRHIYRIFKQIEPALKIYVRLLGKLIWGLSKATYAAALVVILWTVYRFSNFYYIYINMSISVVLLITAWTLQYFIASSRQPPHAT